MIKSTKYKNAGVTLVGHFAFSIPQVTLMITDVKSAIKFKGFDDSYDISYNCGNLV